MDSGFLLTAGGTALVSSLILQWMKESELKIFSFLGVEADKCKANFIVSVLFAFITSIGIGLKYDATAGTLLVTGLTAAGIEHGIWHWFIQWISQHFIYKTAVAPTELQAATVNTLKQILVQLQQEKK